MKLHDEIRAVRRYDDPLELMVARRWTASAHEVLNLCPEPT
jgi:hypothetical protein